MITVKLNSIEKNMKFEKRDGGVYLATVVSYEDEDGIYKEIKVANNFLSQSGSLSAMLDKAVGSKFVKIQVEKRGLYTNLKAIVPTDSAPVAASETTVVAKPTSQRGTFSDNALGMQVGNALTNATTLLASKQRKGTLKEVSIEILMLGEELKQGLASGAYKEKEVEGPGTVVTNSENFEFGDD